MDTYFALQPIFDDQLNVVAYELLYRNAPGSANYEFDDADEASKNVINTTFFGGDPMLLFKDKKVFVNFTEKLLVNKIPLVLPSDKLVVELLETVPCTDEVMSACRELKASGYTIVLDDFVINSENKAFMEFTDIVKIDFRENKKNIERTAKYCRLMGKRLLAEKVETREEFEYARSLGSVLFQGYYFAKPELYTRKDWAPLRYTLERLLKCLDDGSATSEEIGDIISRDMVMTLKFLRFVNYVKHDSEIMGISSVKEAVELAGKELLREFADSIDVHQTVVDPSGVTTAGYFRAKYCQSLAKHLGCTEAQCSEAYLLGLLSVAADVCYEGSANTVDTLPVSAAIKLALERSGTLYSEIYNAVRDYEMADWDGIDRFCKKHSVSQSDMSDLYVEAIEHTNRLNSGIFE